MQVKVTGVGAFVTKANSKGKNYKTFELQYEANGRGGKRQVNEYSDAFGPLSKSIPGQTFDITTSEKDGYTNWDRANLVEGATSDGVASDGASTTQKPSASPAGYKSTYETPEERAKKQVFIVRQSSIGHALTFVGKQGDEYSVEDVLDVAKQFEAYVFGNMDLPDSDVEIREVD